MIFLTILIFAVSIFEIRAMKRRKQNKEIVVFIVLAALSLSLGYLYLSNPYGESLAQRILKVIGKEF